MKARSLFFLMPVLVFAMVSCTSTRPIMDDDVYVMQTPDIPIGKDLLDETSYDTYKYRINADVQTNGYYHQNNRSAINAGPVFMLSSNWFAYGRWNNFGTLPYMNSPYWGAHPNGFYMMEGIPGMGFNQNGFYGSSFAYGYPMFYGNSWYQQQNFYHPNGAFFNHCAPMTTGFYGSSPQGSGITSNYVYNGSSGPVGNFVSGPRATAGGYYSNSNRSNGQQLKSQTFNKPNVNNRPSGYTSRTRTTRTTPNYSRTDNTARTRTPQRTYSNTRSNTQRGTVSSGTRSTSTSRPTPTFRGSSTPTQTRSSGSSGSSGGRSSGSSGSSGGRSGSSSGRSGGRGL